MAAEAYGCERNDSAIGYIGIRIIQSWEVFPVRGAIERLEGGPKVKAELMAAFTL